MAHSFALRVTRTISRRRWFLTIRDESKMGNQNALSEHETRYRALLESLESELVRRHPEYVGNIHIEIHGSQLGTAIAFLIGEVARLQCELAELRSSHDSLDGYVSRQFSGMIDEGP